MHWAIQRKKICLMICRLIFQFLIAAIFISLGMTLNVWNGYPLAIQNLVKKFNWFLTKTQNLYFNQMRTSKLRLKFHIQLINNILLPHQTCLWNLGKCKLRYCLGPFICTFWLEPSLKRQPVAKKIHEKIVQLTCTARDLLLGSHHLNGFFGNPCFMY